MIRQQHSLIKSGFKQNRNLPAKQPVGKNEIDFKDDNTGNHLSETEKYMKRENI